MCLVYVEHPGSTVTAGSATRARSPSPVVAARRPSSRPASASAKAPVQTERTRAPRRAASRIAVRAAAGRARRSRSSGTTAVSARPQRPEARLDADLEAARRRHRAPSMRAGREGVVRGPVGCRAGEQPARERQVEGEVPADTARRPDGASRWRDEAWQKSIGHCLSCHWRNRNCPADDASMSSMAVSILIFRRPHGARRDRALEVLALGARLGRSPRRQKSAARSARRSAVSASASTTCSATAPPPTSSSSPAARETGAAGRRRVLDWLRASTRQSLDDLGLHRLAGPGAAACSRAGRRPATGCTSNRCASTAPTRSAAAGRGGKVLTGGRGLGRDRHGAHLVGRGSAGGRPGDPAGDEYDPQPPSTRAPRHQSAGPVHRGGWPTAQRRELRRAPRVS